MSSINGAVTPAAEPRGFVTRLGNTAIAVRLHMALEDRLHAALGAYMAAPGWMRAAAGTVYSFLPDRLRYGPGFDAFGRDAGRSTDGVDWSEVEERLDATLRAAVHCAAYAPHAPVLLDARRPAWSRLQALPLVSKTDLKARLGDHVSRNARPTDLLETFTGGSTAHPMRFYLQRHVTRPKESAYIRHVERSLLRAGTSEWTLSLRGRTVATAAQVDGALWTIEPIKRHLLFSTDHLEPRYMPAYVEALARHRPPVIHAFPSALYPLARWLDAHACAPFTTAVRGILLTSENVYDFQSSLFRKVFPNAAVIEHYGHSERVLMAVREPGAPGCSFFPLYGLPELVDDQGRSIDEPGVLGEIVGTSFDNHAMPFIRYRTGDMGMWLETPRRSGKVRFAMARIEGRRQEFVVCADRRLVSITTLGAAHFGELSQVHAIQFEQREPGRLVLKLVAARPLAPADRQRIAAAVREKTQGGCTVEVVEVASIERTLRGKHRMLIQHLDLDTFLGASVTPAQEDALLVPEAAIHE